MRITIVFAVCITAGCSHLPSDGGRGPDMGAGQGTGGNGGFGGNGGAGGNGGFGGPADMVIGPDMWRPETLVPTRAYLESVSDDQSQVAYLGDDYQVTNGVATGSLHVQSVPPGAPPVTLAANGAHDARFSGSLLLFATGDHGLSLWKPGMTAALMLTPDAFTSVAAPDGSFALFVDRNQSQGPWPVRLVRSASCSGASCTVTDASTCAASATASFVSSDGKYVAIAAIGPYNSTQAFLVDIAAAKTQFLCTTTYPSSTPSPVALSADGTMIATLGASSGNQPLMFSTATGKQISWASVGPSQNDDLVEVVFGGSTDVFLLTQKGSLWRTTATNAHFIGSGTFDRFSVAPPYRYLFAHTPAAGMTPESTVMFDLSMTPPTSTTLGNVSDVPQVSADGSYAAYLRDPTAGHLTVQPLPSGTSMEVTNIARDPLVFLDGHRLLYTDIGYSPSPLFVWDGGSQGTMIVGDSTSFVIRGTTLYYSTTGYSPPIGILRQPL